ncbi:TetR/AcrR family transcriptional regulator [Mycobacterium sp. SMC-4]|uniref:TetR/AcrR family transcriptional regulator n=1 Tax=Mycobacterium sp. SMC-4 TaxID=2857059 RepID=UPI003D0652FF
MTPDRPIPRALEALWRNPDSGTRTRGLSRQRIVEAAVEIADSDGLAALSMARLAERLGCGTMSLYRHVANKDELVTFMVSAAPGPPPDPAESAQWRHNLTDWAHGLWDVYHRHPWILEAAAGPPVDPGQLAWLDAGLATMGPTSLSEHDKLAAVMAILHFVRGSAALDLAAGAQHDAFDHPALLREFVDADRHPALAAALRAGVFDGADDRGADFRSGLRLILDGIATRLNEKTPAAERAYGGLSE